MDSVVEQQLRLRIFDWVQLTADKNGGYLTRDQLLNFTIDGKRFPLIDYSRGIRNPQDFASTLSIVSTINGPYDDRETDDGFLHYSYQSGDPYGSANRKLRLALETATPLILFRKEFPGFLTPTVPVFVVADDPVAHCFIIAVDEAFTLIPNFTDLNNQQRSYAQRIAKQRLHQPAFRTRVMLAYQTQCAVCHLKHASMLDAAHIVPDSHELGVPTVNNGLALCKIHHTAYDQNIMGITPIYK